jgi:hypothetical protein
MPNRINADGASAGHPSGRPRGAIIYGGAYYQILTATDNPLSNSIAAFKSTDGGGTWTELDSSNRPNSFGGGPAVSWDGVSSDVLVAFYEFPGNVALIHFDLGTETWGIPFGNSGSPALEPIALWQRSDSAWYALFIDPADFDSITLKSAIWDGASWGSEVDLVAAAGIPDDGTVQIDVQGPASVVDPDDALHVFFRTRSFDDPDYENRFFYERVAGGSVSSVLDFGNDDLADTVQSKFLWLGAPSSAVAVIGDSLYWGVFRYQTGGVSAAQFAALYIGTPLSSPTFTPTGPIDPDGAAASTTDAPVGAFPAMQYDGATLYGTFVRWSSTNSIPSQIVQAYNTSGDYDNPADWQSRVLFDYQVTPLSPAPEPPYHIVDALLALPSSQYAFGIQGETSEPVLLPHQWFSGGVFVANTVRIPRMVRLRA